jgi:hypothetical protein
MGAYGAPASVVGKLVMTTPASMTWLTTADLAVWDVRMLPQPE